MNALHTQEPWRVGAVKPARFPSYPIVDNASNVVAEISIMAHGRSQFDAARIVACVNACEGISTEDLEANLHPGAAPSDRDSLRASNAKLREALTAVTLVAADFDVMPKAAMAMYEIARAALKVQP